MPNPRQRRPLSLQKIQKIIADLVADGLAYDTGIRRDGRIVWGPTQKLLDQDLAAEMAVAIAKPGEA